MKASLRYAMPQAGIENVSDTAFWIAHFRGAESERADALFHDPLAARLAGRRGREIAAAMPMSRMVAWTVVMRTCIIDGYIESALAQGVDTVLNLGAGLDTRPYRMALPPTLRWVEVDYPHIVEYKQTHLAGEHPRCRLERASVDLAHLQERRTLLARINADARRLLILTEGVIPYLTLEEGASLAEDMRTLDHSMYWIVDYLSPAAVKYRQRGGMKEAMKHAPFRFEPDDWFGFFSEHGWRAHEIRYFAEEGERLGRPIPLPSPIRVAMRFWMLFLDRQRQAALRRFAGYAMLEPG